MATRYKRMLTLARMCLLRLRNSCNQRLRQDPAVEEAFIKKARELTDVSDTFSSILHLAPPNPHWRTLIVFPRNLEAYTDA